MHVYFSGIGGAGVGPLALVAYRGGYTVSGSDKQHSSYIDYLRAQGISNVHIGQSYDQIARVHAANPIDWFVYSSAVSKEQGNEAPELRFCREHNIRTTKRNVFLRTFLDEKNLKLIAIAGTHGKTTTTAMAVWLYKQLGTPESHLLPAKASFGHMGEYDPASKIFIYEADEYDQNFLEFYPHMSIITGVDWDHPDVFPTREAYVAAFRTFINQSEEAVIWDADLDRLGLKPSKQHIQIHESDPRISQQLHLPGLVNRQNAWAVAHAVQHLTKRPLNELLAHLDRFPGVGRRFEQIMPNLYSDYAHTVPKIKGALQLAREVGGDNVVVVYEGLHNTRQHFIKTELEHLFDTVKHLYIVPSYLAREDKSLAYLTPADLRSLLSNKAQTHTTPVEPDEALKKQIQAHIDAGDLVLCLTAGGGGSLDEWLRNTFRRG